MTLRPWQIFVWVFVAVWFSVGAWSLATPLGASPDEPEHFIQAAALVRGEFNGHQVPLRYGIVPIRRIGTVEVPQWVTGVTDPLGVVDLSICTEASCAVGLPPNVTSDRSITTATQFSNYPPLYYAVVGTPTLLATGTGALYGVRFLGVLIDSATIALGLFLLVRYHPRRSVLVGAMVALSPMVLFICAVVSSSGIEIAAAFAAWCGGLCILEADPPPPPLAILTALSFVLLILSRPISPVNAVGIVVVLGVLAGSSRVRQLGRTRTTRLVAVAIIGALALAGAFLLVVGLPTLTGHGVHPPLSALGSVWLTLRLAPGQLRQSIGDFGWLDVPAPGWVVAVWTIALLSVLGFALAVSRRARRALPLLVLGIVVMPILFEAPQLNTVGPYWEGRYWLPLAVGLPLVASSVLPRFDRVGVVLGTLGVLAAAQITAFVTTLETYNGRFTRPGSGVTWSPPLGVGLVTAVFIVGQLLLVGFVVARWLSDPNPSASAVGKLEEPVSL